VLSNCVAALSVFLKNSGRNRAGQDCGKPVKMFYAHYVVETD